MAEWAQAQKRLALMIGVIVRPEQEWGAPESRSVRTGSDKGLMEGVIKSASP